MDDVTSASFPRLASAVRLGGVTIPNRVVMAAMSTALGTVNGEVTPELIEFLGARAAGGVGMIVVEFTCCDTRFGRAELKQLTLEDAGNLPGHRRLVEKIHAHKSVACLQLHMPGQFVERQTIDAGRHAGAPSDVMDRGGAILAKAFSSGEIHEIVEKYATAARLAVEAGYDAIEIHGAHGYLPMAFLSPRSNRRSDEWGGDFERRLTFPVRILRAVKNVVGPQRALIYRMSTAEFIEGGLTIDDTEKIAPSLVNAGADALHLTSGTMLGSFHKMIDTMSDPEGWRLSHSARIKAVVGDATPVIAIGPFRWPATAETAIEQGATDLISLGRPLLTDPAWMRKAQAGQIDRIIPCTNCNWCMERVRAHLPIGCAENPRTGQESILISGVSTPSKQAVAVIGGGPAGMAAALQLNSAGFETHLYEGRSALGGGLIASAAPPGKEKLNWYKKYLTDRISKSSIHVHLNVRPDAKSLLKSGVNAVLIATGASEVAVEIPGAKSSIVKSAYSLLMEEVTLDPETASPVIVYGGGETGCEVTEYLTDQGLQVILVSRSAHTQLARSAEAVYRKLLRLRLSSNSSVTLMTHCHLQSVTEVGAWILHASGAREFVAAKLVVFAQGRAPSDELAAQLRQSKLPFTTIGDARRIGRIGDAVHDAHTAVRSLLQS